MVRLFFSSVLWQIISDCMKVKLKMGRSLKVRRSSRERDNINLQQLQQRAGKRKQAQAVIIQVATRWHIKNASKNYAK